MQVQTNDLEQKAVEMAQALSAKTGVSEQVLIEEFVMFQSLIRSILGSRLDEAYDSLIDSAPVDPNNPTNTPLDRTYVRNGLTKTLEQF